MTVLLCQTNMPGIDGSTINRTKSDCNQSGGSVSNLELEVEGERGKGNIYNI